MDFLPLRKKLRASVRTVAAAPLRPGLLASARTSRAEHLLHPASFPARCGSGAGSTRRRRDVARGHADHRADARREGLDRVTACGPWRHRGGSGRRTHGRASRWPHPTSAKVRFGATAPQPQLPEAVRHCAAVCCCRAVAVAAVQAVAAEAKTCARAGARQLPGRWQGYSGVNVGVGG